MNKKPENDLFQSEVSKISIANALIRKNLASFIQRGFTTLNPGTHYIDNWHIHAIAWYLEQVRLGHIKRLIITMPPRSLKSISATVAFPAFIHGHDPSKRIITVSYSQDLSVKLHNDYRLVIESDCYRRLFPNTRIDPRKDTEREILLTGRGMRLATSIGGTLTGRGGDIIIIDDPLKAADAMSEAKRSFVNEWFGSTLTSRLDDKSNGAIVIVTQRLHADDLVGHVLEKSPDGWAVLNLPAIADKDQIIKIGDNRIYCRNAGDILQPTREPRDVLNQLRRDLGSDAFEAQYQQNPVPPGGLMFKRDWIKRYDTLPECNKYEYTIIQSWDTASKAGPANDWSVCTTWMVHNNIYYLMDAYRGKLDYPALKAKAIQLAHDYSPHIIIVEDTGVGTGLISDLQQSGFDVAGTTPQHSKEARASVQSSKIEGGRVLFPHKASWLSEFETELLAFPGGRHDDQVDSMVQALAHEIRGPVRMRTPDGRWI